MKDEHIGRYISMAYRSNVTLLNKKLSNYGIGRGEYPFLIALYKKEGICQKSLCDFYNIDKAAAGRAIKKLVDKGFIIKKTDPHDKRRQLLYLTPKSKDFKKEFIGILKSNEKKMKKDLTEEEIEVFLKVIKKICFNLGVESTPLKEE
ncbi:MarR family winged helix-turn-helix transcriptional regulator [Orenia marismortui]|uniref:MarR family winged helix-turn-helix transcriptional regulator n=1 Tax=Orenia marismortui TaxID=46469 RepID=UPI00037D4101|nr:MarR family winged helix-turn-helix transcriptional regulator [Orenia marismortui]